MTTISTIVCGNRAEQIEEVKACHAGLAQRAACPGDIVTMELDLRPENGFVPEPLFDTSGTISFVLGWGNYLPGLHALVEGMKPGESAQDISIDAGWGERNPDLVVDVPLSRISELAATDRKIQNGDALSLPGGIEVTVVGTTDSHATVDANPPLAGTSYACSLRVLSVEAMPVAEKGESYTDFDPAPHAIDEASPFAVATFGIGCFWGGELAFMRTPGVVGTKVGYSQGIKPFPSYEEVCEGSTQHRESVHVVYDTRIQSYEGLLEVYMDRLATTTSKYKLDLFAHEYASKQYKHGIYFHTDEQRRLAQAVIDANQNQYKVELRQAARFYHAESYHQQYLLKGGQSARKGDKVPIRCFG